LQIRLKPLQRISPSTLSSLRYCQLKTVLSSNHIQYALPKNPSQRIGTVIHQVIESYSKTKTEGGNFNSLWDKCVDDQEAQMREKWFEWHLIPLRRTALDYEVKKIQCSMLLRVKEKNVPFEISEVLSREHEKWLRSKDGLVVGCVDEIRYERENDGATLIDYKTGVIEDLNGEGMLQKYIDQLKLYAALFYEQTDKWPVRLMIVTLNGNQRLVDFEKKDCLSLLQATKEILYELNKRIETTIDRPCALATPIPENCQYCLYRPICEAYFLKRKANDSMGWPNDVWGTIIEKKVLLNGLGKIILRPISGDTGSLTQVRGLQLERYPSIECDQTLGIFSLRSDNLNNSFTECQYTTIYKAIDLW
jgi:CRISPR/Cas system-associated exonuclease Cas4 (RecB family)